MSGSPSSKLHDTRLRVPTEPPYEPALLLPSPELHHRVEPGEQHLALEVDQRPTRARNCETCRSNPARSRFHTPRCCAPGMISIVVLPRSVSAAYT